MTKTLKVMTCDLRFTNASEIQSERSGSSHPSVVPLQNRTAIPLERRGQFWCAREPNGVRFHQMPLENDRGHAS